MLSDLSLVAIHNAAPEPDLTAFCRAGGPASRFMLPDTKCVVWLTNEDEHSHHMLQQNNQVDKKYYDLINYGKLQLNSRLVVC